jgi:AAA15 family ATPase/GTPase
MKAELKIKNFRTLNNAKIDMRPTMFLLGPNGAGKSTFIKSLLFLSKVVNSPDNKFNYLIPDSEMDFVSYENIVSDKNISKIIEYNFEFDGEIDLEDFMIISGVAGGTTR